MAKSKYVTEKKKEINKAIEFSINEHLSILNSDIILPMKRDRMKNEIVNEIRLLPTVKSREIVYNNLISFLDDPNVNVSIKSKSAPKTIQGLKRTMDELIKKIILRPLRVDQDTVDIIEDALPMFMVDESSDDIISSTSNAAKAAKELVLSIIDKIEILEDPETHKREKIENEIIPSIAERYARN